MELPELSPAEITALLNQPRRRGKRAKFYGFDENMQYVPNPTASEKGGFTGKAGTMRRTRKGATRRNPNGNRRYEAGNLLAYKPNSVVR